MNTKLSLFGLLALSLASACADDFGDEAGFEDEDVASTSSALTIPVLDYINTCDNKPVVLQAAAGDKFNLLPADGAGKFTAQLYTALHLNCSVGVKFNVPQGYRAKVRLGTTIGVWGTNQTQNAGFTNQTGFTFDKRPVSQADTQYGPSLEETLFLPKAKTGSLDLQIDTNDDPNNQLKTGCGTSNVWYYVRPRTDAAASVVLQTIVASFKLEQC